MEMILTTHEVRVLGSLIEKELTTPEYYPLTLNSLVLACNQKSNRDPVMDLSQNEVTEALESLRAKHLAWRRSIAGDRVSKYEHNLTTFFSFTVPQTAIVGILFLRGPQTLAELRTKTKRMHDFTTHDEIATVLQELMSPKEDIGPFVIELPKMPGQKENRYMHLLAGTVEIAPEEQAKDHPVTHSSLQEETNKRIDQLEHTIVILQDEIALLKQQLYDFKKNFE